MRKTAIYGFAAALAVSAAMPMTSMAASIVCKTPSAGQNLVIGGNSLQNLLGSACGNVTGLIGSSQQGQGTNCKPNQSQTNSCPTNQCPGNSCQGNSCKPNQNQNSSGRPNGSQTGTLPGLPNGGGQTGTLPSLPNGGQTGTLPGQPDSTVTTDSLAVQVLELVNEERAKAGLSSLTWDTKTAAAAQTRAAEIAVSFSHTRPDGSSYSSALKENGVSYSASGENIAYGQTSAAAVMEQWMNSAAHRANILNPEFTTLGVGHEVSASGVHYWSQLFTD
jgi:uncharacterized protein YkwD